VINFCVGLRHQLHDNIFYASIESIVNPLLYACFCSLIILVVFDD